MGPAEPSGFVGFPLGGHATTESVRRFGLRLTFHWEKESNTETTPARSGQAPDAERTEKSKLFVPEPAVQDGLIGVNAAVTEEGPVAARFLALGGGAFYDEGFFLLLGRLWNELAERVCA